MAEVIFNYEGTNTTIQCNLNNKMKDIIDKFLIKIDKRKDNYELYYLYDGTCINKDSTFNELAKELDKTRKKMNILVTNNKEYQIQTNEIISKDIICPECKENSLIDIKNFKINISGCKNNHVKKDILLYEFKEIQKIDLNLIICEICRQNNKGNTYNYEFYICNTCNKNICPLCKTIHDKKHKIINYDDKNYICNQHNESFHKYCKTCKDNICFICETKHNGHDIFDLRNILIDEGDALKTLNDLKIAIGRYKSKINEIKEIFDKMTNLMDIYYKMNDDIINNYNLNKRHYHQLQNLIFLKKNNEKLLKELNDITYKDNISAIFEFASNNFYNDKGEKYIGEMKNGLKEGKGILYYEKDNDKKRKKYEGDFKNNEPDGKGILYWKHGDKYEGCLKKDKMEGKGVYRWKDGERYEGDRVNGIIEGKGKYYFNNGDRYEGDWKNNLKEGIGIMYFRNGDRYEGYWKNDKKEGNGIYYYKNGGGEERLCKGDKFVKN